MVAFRCLSVEQNQAFPSQGIIIASVGRLVGPISISRLNWTETFHQVLQGLAATAAAAAALDQES